MARHHENACFTQIHLRHSERGTGMADRRKQESHMGHAGKLHVNIAMAPDLWEPSYLKTLISDTLSTNCPGRMTCLTARNH